MVTALDGIFRAEWGRVLATLIGVLGDFDLAEDAAQEATEARAAYLRARALTDDGPGRRFLDRRLTELPHGVV
ncbi:hypothetical protein [Dactylosporangium sp. NPDC050588]|uniref:hypothetical protein n=1 Tax=Dactylosporangium sp. NPDC050588 TaxID=3157211 RepID=UPI0033D38AC6